MKHYSYLILSAFVVLATSCSKAQEEQAKQALQKAEDQAAQAAQTTKDAASQLGESSAQLVEQGTDLAKQTGEKIADKTQSLTDSARDQAQQGIDSAKQSLADAKQSMDSTVTASKEALKTVPAKLGMNGDVDAGKKTFNTYCGACHISGIAGAPKVGDNAEWTTRSAQGMDTLVDHALNGYTGEAGIMPPKGGFSNLSEQQIKDAVSYMVSASQ